MNFCEKKWIEVEAYFIYAADTTWIFWIISVTNIWFIDQD